MGIFKMFKETKKALQEAAAPDPAPKQPKKHRIPTDEEIERQLYLWNECVAVEGFLKYKDIIDALPGDTAVAVVEMTDKGCFLRIHGDKYGYLWNPKPKQLGLKDGQRVLVEVYHPVDKERDSAQLFIPKVR